MNKTKSLKLNTDFRRTYYKGKSVACRHIIVYIRKNRLNSNRLGLTCSKTIGKAVVRNRIKRLMRESYRLMEYKVNSGYDIVIVARHRTVGASLDLIMKDLSYAFFKLEMFL